MAMDANDPVLLCERSVISSNRNIHPNGCLIATLRSSSSGEKHKRHIECCKLCRDQHQIWANATTGKEHEIRPNRNRFKAKLLNRHQLESEPALNKHHIKLKLLNRIHVKLERLLNSHHVGCELEFHVSNITLKLADRNHVKHKLPLNNEHVKLKLALRNNHITTNLPMSPNSKNIKIKLIERSVVDSGSNSMTFMRNRFDASSVYNKIVIFYFLIQSNQF